MKYTEIILKLLFLAGIISYFTVREFFWIQIGYFILVAGLLGLFLIFNTKHQSYGYELSNREIRIRRIEGALLVSFALVFAYLKSRNLI